MSFRSHSRRSSCSRVSRLYSASFRHGLHVWPIASMRWLSNWKRMDRSIDANCSEGSPTSGEGPTSLDAAVMMGTLGGVATSCAALLLFVGTLARSPRRVLIRGVWLGAAFHNGCARRILDRNAARQPWATAIRRITQTRSGRIGTNSPRKEPASRRLARRARRIDTPCANFSYLALRDRPRFPGAQGASIVLEITPLEPGCAGVLKMSSPSPASRPLD